MSEQPGFVVPQRIAGHLTMSRQALEDAVDLSTLIVAAWNAPPPTAEQRAAAERARAERNAANQATWTRLLDAGGLIAEIAAIHSPDDGYCRECGGEDPPGWPCSTAQALIDYLESA